MTKNKILLSLVCTGFLALSFIAAKVERPESQRVMETSNVAEILHQLGQAKTGHWIQTPSQELIKQGKDLVFTGRTIGPDGKRTKQQSRYFECTDCHNQVQEDPDLRKSDPETRINYTIDREIPFLQGTTFFGIVNRETFYNDDYLKKYGSLVEKARNDLRESIQICSINCSSGRTLDEWEIDAILAYFWTLQYQIEDLGVSSSDRKKIEAALKGGDKKSAIKLLKSYYLQASPANFDEGPANHDEGYGLKGNVENGSKVYNQSCLSCHSSEGPSNYLKLDNSKQSKRFFRSRMQGWKKGNLYQIIRHGTYADAGHKAYMPHYPRERMSNQQVEDLRAYIESN